VPLLKHDFSLTHRAGGALGRQHDGCSSSLFDCERRKFHAGVKASGAVVTVGWAMRDPCNQDIIDSLPPLETHPSPHCGFDPGSWVALLRKSGEILSQFRPLREYRPLF
jgi:hypothetical protein